MRYCKSEHVQILTKDFDIEVQQKLATKPKREAKFPELSQKTQHFYSVELSLKNFLSNHEKQGSLFSRYFSFNFLGYLNLNCEISQLSLFTMEKEKYTGSNF